MPEFNTTVNRARVAGTPNIGFPWRLLIISVVIFGLTLLVYVGIEFGYIPYLNAQINSTGSQLDTLSKNIDQNQQQALSTFYSQLYNIQTLQGTHVYSSRLFDFLEKNIYPTVKITTLQSSVSGGSVRLDGIATDFATLTNQLAILKANSSISLVTLDSSRQRNIKEGGGVEFTIQVNFVSGFFSGVTTTQ